MKWSDRFITYPTEYVKTMPLSGLKGVSGRRGEERKTRETGAQAARLDDDLTAVSRAPGFAQPTMMSSHSRSVSPCHACSQPRTNTLLGHIA